MDRYRYTLMLFVLIVMASPGGTFAQDDDSAPPPEQTHTLEWSGNLDVKYTLYHMQDASTAYALQFPGQKPSTSYLTQYRFEPYLNAAYTTRELGFSLKTHALYFSDADASAEIFEAYGRYSPSMNTTLQAGKRVYSWGKGYAFNPVGYVNPVKDPENPELAQSGLLSATVEYVKGFSSGSLKNMSLMVVVIPASGTAGNQFGELNQTDLAIRASVLLWDTDIDLMGYYGRRDARRIGMGLSRNLTANTEVHGEWSYSWNAGMLKIVNNAVASDRMDGPTYLVGFRFLHESNTTLIAEYYHNALGMSASAYDAYQHVLASAVLANEPAVLQQAASASQVLLRGTNLMQDYLYVKLTSPEPFDWLYFTPAVFAIYNVADKSVMLSASLSYRPATNIEFILWPTLVTGGENTEYGSKAFRQKVEAWMRVFF